MAGSYEREVFLACGECIVPSKPLMEALRGLGHRLIQWTATLTTARGIIAKLKAGTGPGQRIVRFALACAADAERSIVLTIQRPRPDCLSRIGAPGETL